MAKCDQIKYDNVIRMGFWIKPCYFKNGVPKIRILWRYDDIMKKQIIQTAAFEEGQTKMKFVLNGHFSIESMENYKMIYLGCVIASLYIKNAIPKRNFILDIISDILLEEKIITVYLYYNMAKS